MSAPLADTERCEVIVFDPRSCGVVGDVSRRPPVLPSVPLDGLQRTAHHLCRFVRDTIGIPSLLLWLEWDRNPRLAVHDLALHSYPLKDGFEVLPLDAFRDRLPPSVLTRLRSGCPQLGRFATPQWLQHTESLFTLGELVDLEHWNAGTNFCLLKFWTTRGTYWLKAVGRPNEHEFAQTLLLRELAPEALPEIVCTIPEWNAWVSRDIQGVPFNELKDRQAAVEVFSTLATLQKRTIAAVPDLRKCGMEDFSTTSLLHSLPTFFLEVSRAMAAQTSSKVAPLDDLTLKALQGECRKMIEQFGNMSIPETVVHGDTGHGNILLTETGPKFLDWAEAWIAHPFVGAEFLLADLRNNSSFDGLEDALREHYCSLWREFCNTKDLGWAKRFAPALGALTFAAAIARKAPPTSQHHWPLLRSLVRETRRRLDFAKENM